MAIKRSSKIDMGGGSASQTDLIFLLLLFLMISTTLINPNALKLLLPKSSNANKEKPYTTVSITADLQYFVEMEQVSFGELAGRLKAKLEGVEEPTVSLHCDRTVPVDEVVKVMNIARDNKYKLVLATAPE
ncbi:biopolymer transporter ExbD [uncultured Rikenella sp.]|uniref:ExbD/TolR family protein n=1 Tax=uncultured Rikenella sp. TaxID=368003 RepID=UPI002639CD89|nr:biopolymer transporter ExbD [uncultured Rikenella sp.]